jgi:hypothetical protein
VWVRCEEEHSGHHYGEDLYTGAGHVHHYGVHWDTGISLRRRRERRTFSQARVQSPMLSLLSNHLGRFQDWLRVFAEELMPS